MTAFALHASVVLIARLLPRAAHKIHAPPVAVRTQAFEIDLLEVQRPAATPAIDATLPAARRSDHATPMFVARVTRPTKLQDAVPEPVAPESASESVSSEAVAPDETNAPRLSLEQLGIGKQNRFIDPRAQPRRRERNAKAPRVDAQTRFDRALANDIIRAERAVGLGPEAPVLAEIEQATRTETTPPNSAARFRCSTDSNGRLVSVELIGSSSDTEPWRRVARKVFQALAAQRLRIPNTRYGVVFDVRVVSRVVLPSGADPGLAINVLGIPVQQGEGPRSARLDILNIVPTLTTEEVKLPSGQTLQLPVLSLGQVLKLAGDPADIGSPAARVVHAHVESIDANAAER